VPYASPTSTGSIFDIPVAPDMNVIDVGPAELIGTHLRWCNARDLERLAGHMAGPGNGRPGYAFVQGKDVNETKRIARELGRAEAEVDVARNRIMCKENVLCYIPRAEHELRKQEMAEEARARRAGIGEAFDSAIDGLNTPHIKPFRREVGEIQERKAHAEREGQPFVGQVGGVPVTRAT
jgi:hypothetical protein